MERFRPRCHPGRRSGGIWPVTSGDGLGGGPGASQWEDGRVPTHLALVLGLDGHHPDSAVALERGGRHLPVARLEDVERHLHLRKEHYAVEREDRNLCLVRHSRQSSLA